MRHSEPTYKEVEERGYIGFGRDLGKLTREGIILAEETALKIKTNKFYNDIELIIASPLTRALQTAAIVSQITGLKIEVETDLHEWLSDEKNGFASWKEYLLKKGIHDETCKYKWEQHSNVRKRALTALERYQGKYKCILVVAHCGVIRAVLNEFKEQINFCEIIETKI